MSLNGKWLCHYGVKGMKWDEKLKKGVDNIKESYDNFVNPKVTNDWTMTVEGFGVVPKLPLGPSLSKDERAAKDKHDLLIKKQKAEKLLKEIKMLNEKLSRARQRGDVNEIRNIGGMLMNARKNINTLPRDVVANTLLKIKTEDGIKKFAGMVSKPKQKKDVVTASKEYWEELGYNSKKNR